MDYEDILNKAIRYGEYTHNRRCSHSYVVGMVQWLLRTHDVSNLKVSDNDSAISFNTNNKHCVIKFKVCL